MSRKLATITLALTCLALCSSARAAESGWMFRVHAAFVDTSAGIEASVGDPSVAGVNLGGAFGVGFGFEYRISHRVGIDISTLLTGLDINVESTADGQVTVGETLQMLPVTFGVPIHFEPGGAVDIYVAPTVSFVNYFDLDVSVDEGQSDVSLNFGSDTAPGVTVGLEVPAGRRWAFSAGVRYIKTEAEEIDVDPTIVTVGFAHRF